MKEQKYSHTFYFEAWLLGQLKQLAQEQRRSLNFIVNDLLTVAVKQRKGDPDAIPDYHGSVRIIPDSNDLPAKYTATNAPG
jgi:hypothetical protein